MRTPWIAFLIVSVTMASGCSGCGNSQPADGGDGGTVIDARSDASGTDVATDTNAISDTGLDGAEASTCRGVMCNAACCNIGQLCRHDRCIADFGRCTPPVADAGIDASRADAGAGAGCPSDTYCDAMGFCTPYGIPAGRDNDPTCRSRAIPAPLVPATQCEWTLHNINGTPVVANLGLSPTPDSPTAPSIVVAVNNAPGSPYTSGGYIHIFDSTSCTIQAALTDPAQIVASAGTAAIGDIDMDGRPEILAESGTGGVIAFHFDMTARRWTTLWHSDMSPGPFTGAAVALADLGGDAHPEVILGGYVYDWQGRLMDGTVGALPYVSYSTPVALADVDLDGVTELIGNNGIYQLDAMGRLVRESYDRATATEGFVAVADFGEFPGRAGDAPGRPEIVLYAASRLIVRTIGGDTVFSADGTAIQGGGPPAVADLDGDGYPEIVVAGHAMMAFDPDCVTGAARGGSCASGRTDGVLWNRGGLQDGSSAINGVTVFDFDGDGRVEVVEADECFVRIFDGTTGEVRWSAARLSCTFIEMPIIADVDGDNSAEIVVTANAYCPGACGLATGAPDPLLRGFACASDSACPVGTSCRGGVCRCTSSAECGPNNVCTAPLTADGMGNVCRSTFRPSIGLKVYGDARNRWVPSRPIWNQYSYVVSNVNDDGSIPSAASARNNWSVPGLNNFRQNTQGALGDQTAPNLTISPTERGCVDDGSGMLTLQARFCNRGTGVAGSLSSIRFESVGLDGGRTVLCTASAPDAILPGRCVDISCRAMFRLDGRTSIEAVADANDQVQECHEDDNRRIAYRPGDCVL